VDTVGDEDGERDLGEDAADVDSEVLWLKSVDLESCFKLAKDKASWE